MGIFRKLKRDAAGQKLVESRLATEHAIVSVLAQAPQIDEAARRILQAVCETAGWEFGALWLVDAEKGVLRCAQTWHDADRPAPVFEQMSLATPLAQGVGLPGRVWASGEPAWISDVIDDVNFPRLVAARADGLHGAVAFPVLRAGRVAAVMEFFTRRVRAPDQQLMMLLRVVGGQIGQFMARREAEDQLRRSQQQAAAVLQVALDCVVSMDHQGKVTEWNEAAAATFGYRRDEAIGRELAELVIPPELRDQHRMGLAHYLKTAEGPVIGKRLEITSIRRSGEKFPVELAITRVPGEPPSFTGYLRDITRRMSDEVERARLLEAEQSARREAELANRTKDNFLATVSHELRTPLTAILGWVQMLRMGSATEQDTAHGLETIERNAHAMAQLVEDVLDVSRIITGKLRLDVRPVELQPLILAAIDAVRPAANAKGIHLHQHLGGGHEAVSGDPARLQQVVWNLLSNAIKFTPRGGEVSISMSAEASQVRLTVTDNGEGIPHEFLPRLFERFTQADSSTRKAHGGLGLGLAIVRHLVELHGGTVSAKSAGKGAGATFVVSLPLVSVVNTFDETRTAQVSDGGGGVLDSIHVLVVEDEPDSRRLIETILARHGAQVQSVHSTEAAIEAMRQRTPDVLLSDIGMPGQDGYDLIQYVRACEQLRSVPAAAVTALARAEDRERALAAGYQLHVSKPVEARELVHVVMRLARERPDQRDQR